MKALLIGDVHGLSTWKQIVSKHRDVDKVVFVGDYFDSFDISPAEQMYNFSEIIRFKEESDADVTLLIGNHDHHYMDIGETYSGYSHTSSFEIGLLLKDNMKHLQMVEVIGDVLLSHAGVSPVWMDNNFPNGWSKSNVKNDINDLYGYKPRSFNFTRGSLDPYGNSVDQGPMWIRPKALMKANKGDDGLEKKYVQVFGHTRHETINNAHSAFLKSNGEKYFCIDTLHSGGYAIYEDGELIPKQL